MLLLNFLGVISSCLLSVTEQNISIAKANEAIGAPIFYGNTNYIVGIHSGGIHNWLINYNVAYRISSYIESWIINARVDWAL